MPITITLLAANAAGSTDGLDLHAYGADQNAANTAAAAQALRQLADDVEAGVVAFSALDSISIVYDAG